MMYWVVGCVWGRGMCMGVGGGGNYSLMLHNV